jgi:hypothetical protein
MFDPSLISSMLRGSGLVRWAIRSVRRAGSPGRLGGNPCPPCRLDKAGLVHDPDSGGISDLLGSEVAQIVADRLGVLTGRVKQPRNRL